MPAIQKRIRDLERALKRKASDDPSREALEVKLESLREEKKQHEQQEKERKLSTKYHQVKFFERKKITRRIHKIINKINATAKDGSIDKLYAEKAKLEDDLAYVLYYPKDMKYVSLFVEDEPNPQKTEALRQKARARALQLYSEDKKQGDDRVAHAIDVELHPTHKTKKTSLHQKNNDRNSDTEEKDSESDDSVSNTDSSSEGDESSSDDSDENSSASESEPDVMKPMTTTTKPTQAKATNNKKNKTNTPATLPTAPTYEPDPFFLEEVTEENNTPLPSSYEAKQSRSAQQPRFQRQPNLKGMHKQEIRMMQWKQKVKAKSKAGYVPPVREKTAPKNVSDKQEKFAPRVNAPKRKFDQSHAPVKTAWEEGRGVSAASSSDLIRQKQTGIVKIQQAAPSKKIKFSD